MKFIFPVNGTCVHKYDGIEQDGGILVPVRILASCEDDIRVNGIKATYDQGAFVVPLLIDGYRNTVTAENLTTGESEKIAVYHVPHASDKYRISVDDNILFLQDITYHRDTYQSIFDNPYLAVFKKAHDIYGTKVHMNLFYEYNADAMQLFSDHKEYFNLSMMTDAFKEEFEANAHWLRFSIHSYAEFPPRPYAHATMEKADEDIKKIHKEIRRFAGDACLSNVCTTHFGSGNRGVVRTLRNHGYRALTGYFTLDKQGNPLVAYYYTKEEVGTVEHRDFWRDEEEDITFGRIDTVLNSLKMDNILPTLEAIKADNGRRGFLSMLIHEQYFYPDYKTYLPFFEDLIMTACKFATENGYQPSFISEACLEEYIRRK
ncbi:MAG TPA: hypothetical protein DCY74_08650 [Clostridiales bacterium]|nr:hypothetical protein [Clostridiales bacterium]